MLTVIAEIRTRPGQHHRQAVLDQFAKIVPTVLKEEGCHGYAPMVDCARLCANGGLRCWREFPVYGTGFYRDD